MTAMNLELPEDRMSRLRRLMEATGEKTKSGAIDVAMQHYLADLKAKRRHADDLDRATLEALSTPWLPLDRGPTSVGRDVEE